MGSPDDELIDNLLAFEDTDGLPEPIQEVVHQAALLAVKLKSASIRAFYEYRDAVENLENG